MPLSAGGDRAALPGSRLCAGRVPQPWGRAGLPSGQGRGDLCVHRTPPSTFLYLGPFLPSSLPVPFPAYFTEPERARGLASLGPASCPFGTVAETFSAGNGAVGFSADGAPGSGVGVGTETSLPAHTHFVPGVREDRTNPRRRLYEHFQDFFHLGKQSSCLGSGSCCTGPAV